MLFDNLKIALFGTVLTLASVALVFLAIAYAFSDWFMFILG